jgi:hypothetical protein
MGGQGSGKMPENAIVKLDGTMISHDGQETRTQLFEFLEVDLDDYSDIELSTEEAQRFMNHVRRMKTGVSAFMPKLCPGPERCPMGHRCPFQDRFPLTKACPLEVDYIKVRTKNYIEGLGVDVGSPHEMALINTLVELDLMDYRANVALSADEEDGPTLLRKTIMMKNESMIEMVGPHPLLEVKERVHNRRQKILEAFAATRREEYKKAAALKKQSSGDVATQTADLREMIVKLSQAVKEEDMEKIIADADKVAQAGMEEAEWQLIEGHDDD